MDDAFAAALAEHRAELLRHCYRMLGSYADAEEAVQEALLNAWKGRASYAGDAPLRHWLFRVTTNVCLNHKRAARRRALPELDAPPGRANEPLGDPVEPAEWVTAAPDDALFPPSGARDPARELEARETISLAFVALLQRLPPQQRAVLLLKDVVGLSAEEMADSLELSVSAVSSALHRARASMEGEPRARPEPSPEVVREYVRCWEERDLAGLLALLRDDVVFTMPPWPTWYRGRADVEAFLTSARFDGLWQRGFRLVPTRANGQTAFLFYRRSDGGCHSIQLPELSDGGVAVVHNLLGKPALHGCVDFAKT